MTQQPPTEASVSITIDTASAPVAEALNPRTGELRRPWAVIVATTLMYLGVALIVAGMLQAFWISISDFAGAAWIHGQIPTEPGDLVRVGIVSGEFALVLALGALALISGYYSWRGYRWPRWWGIAAAVSSVSAWVLNPIAGIGSVSIILGAALLWLPSVAAFSNRWHERRHPRPHQPDIRDDVWYGPLPRYR
ncbi:MAG: hypothetical protein ACK5LN_11085 [Propioniciclava sp.]